MRVLIVMINVCVALTLALPVGKWESGTTNFLTLGVSRLHFTVL